MINFPGLLISQAISPYCVYKNCLARIEEKLGLRSMQSGSLGEYSTEQMRKGRGWPASHQVRRSQLLEKSGPKRWGISSKVTAYSERDSFPPGPSDQFRIYKSQCVSVCCPSHPEPLRPLSDGSQFLAVPTA